MDTNATTAAIVAIGSNIAPETNIPEALALLHAKTSLLALSMFYITPAIERPEQDDYYNGMVTLNCGCTAREFKFDVLRPIEDALGRIRTGDKLAPRTIDLDLTLFGDAVIDAPGLKVPDADLRLRPFLLACLLELEPAAILPDTGERADTLIAPEAVARLRPAAAFTQTLRERFGL